MNLTDNEIIKALKCCGRKHNEKNDTYCKECQFKSYLPCVAFLCDRTIDLINRQKAEIERLQAMVEREREKYERTMTALKAVLDERADHSEAIKEFAERLKEKYKKDFNSSWRSVYNPIDNLVKEMTASDMGRYDPYTDSFVKGQ